MTVLWVSEVGSGSPLLLLHGFTGAYESVASLAHALGRDHRVLVPDLIGHGRSEVGPPEDFTMDACVAQVAEVVAPVAPVLVVGYSMGARVALTLACDHPRLVAGVVTIGGTAGLPSVAEREARMVADAALAEDVRRDGVAAFVDRWMGLPLFATQRRLPPELLRAARAQRLTNREEGLARSLEGMGTGSMAPLHDRLEQLAVPALFLAGEEDPKFRSEAEQMAALAPQATAAVVRGAGHAAHLENEADVVALIRAWWEPRREMPPPH